MKHLKKYLNKKINEKIKNSFDNKNYKFYINNIDFDLIFDLIVICVISLFFSILSLSLISSRDFGFLLITILLGMLSIASSFFVVTMIYKDLKKISKLKKEIMNGNFEIEMMNDIYQDILTKHFLEKKEIETLFDEIRKTGLEEKEVDYCIKMTMSQVNLDSGNLFFIFLLYQNIEKFYHIKNDKYLNEKLYIQKTK